MEAAIRVRGLTKRCGSGSALEGVSFDVSAGEVFGFHGGP
jgi:ABC-type multidrug transport system ATPase subunit